MREFAGLVFAYMGPLDKIPELPIYDVWQKEGGALKARMGPRIGGPVNCNWLQAEENLMDALHTFWLHTRHSGAQFPSQVYGVDPDALHYEETDLGMRFVLKRRLENGKWWELIWEMVMPLNVHLVYTDEPKTERVRAVSYCVPVDDTHQLGASIRWLPDGEPETPSGREQLAPGGRTNASYEYTQRHPDDKEAVEGQGPIALHGLEHLVSSDKGGVDVSRNSKKSNSSSTSGRRSKGGSPRPDEGILCSHQRRQRRYGLSSLSGLAPTLRPGMMILQAVERFRIVREDFFFDAEVDTFHSLKFV